MQFYEPGAYEEFIGKLASISVKPSPKIWKAISDHLDRNVGIRKRLLLNRFAIAASFLLLFGFSYYSISYINIEIPLYSNNESTFNTSLYIPSSIHEDFDINIHYSKLIKQVNIIDQDLVFNASNHENSEIGKNSTELLEPLTVSLPIFFEEDPINGIELITKPKSNPNTYNIEETTIRSNSKKWELFAYINPTFAYHTTAALNSKLNPNEIGAWMWGGDVIVKRRIKRYFSVQTGIQLSPLGQVNKNLILLKSESFNRDMMILYANTSYGNVSLENRVVAISNFSNLSSAPPSVLKSTKFSPAEICQHFYYLEIPLMVSTSIKKKYFDMEFKFGCTAGILVSNKFRVISSEGIFYGKTENIRQYNKIGRAHV